MVMPDFKNEVSYIGRAQTKRSIKRPLFLHRVSAGFPSPADDECESLLDLNELVIRNTESTYFLRVLGYSMENASIFQGDIVIVDRSIVAQPGNVVIAFIQDAFTIKRFLKKGEKCFLQSENLHYPLIEIEKDFEIWGVVTYVLHKP